MKTLLKTTLALLVVLGFTSCNDDDDNGASQDQTATVLVRMVDAPGDYDAVNIDVQDVVVKYNGSEEEVSIGDVDAGIYDLLELTGGASALLANDQIPAGDVSQIRLILGTNNTVVVDGVSYDLATPSAQQSGLKLQLNQTLEPDAIYEFTLDFDVEESIVVQGNGGYSLKPVINLTLNTEVGEIIGIALPANYQILVTASNGTDVVSTYTDANGNYHLYGLDAGFYDLSFEIDPLLGLPPIVVNDVEVNVGLETVVETIVFEPL